MRDYLISFLDEFEYPNDSKPFIINAYDSMMKNKDISQLISTSYEEYVNNTLDWDKAIEKVTELTENTDVHNFTAHLVFFLCMTKHARVLYEQHGFDYSLFKDTFTDFNYKLIECHNRNDVWGTCCYTAWYTGFFTLERFALGRLQYEITAFRGEEPYTAHGVTLNPQDPCLIIHIPSSGPLTPESVEESFALAHNFYKGTFPSEYTPIMCSSWLMFPEHRNMLDENSNIIKFMNRFDMLYTEYYDNYDTPFTILYDRPYNGDVNSYSPDNSFKKGYIELVKQNKPCGYSCGITLYKPQK